MTLNQQETPSPSPPPDFEDLLNAWSTLPKSSKEKYRLALENARQYVKDIQTAPSQNLNQTSLPNNSATS